ncbi:MAG: hypothetical protein QXG00_03910 [Candidatus Woesearchaeota archaeon]
MVDLSVEFIKYKKVEKFNIDEILISYSQLPIDTQLALQHHHVHSGIFFLGFYYIDNKSPEKNWWIVKKIYPFTLFLNEACLKKDTSSDYIQKYTKYRKENMRFLMCLDRLISDLNEELNNLFNISAEIFMTRERAGIWYKTLYSFFYGKEFLK